jgi:UDP-GlcNAc:undecaprenyl-phosphate/decaprenyl-phosphate GlcNAc-1-phosphate transferase
MRTYLGLLFLSALFSLLTTIQVRKLGRRLRAFGKPHGNRQQAQTQIPRLGGLSIFLATLAAWGVLLLVPNEVRARFLAQWRTVLTLLVPGTLVLLMGVYDDVRGATPKQKLAIEAIAAGMVWWAGFRIVSLPVLWYRIQSPLLSFLLTVLWIVAVTNAFNLIDGLDGLAAGIAFFVAISVFVVSLLQSNHFACILAITLAGALLGFLRFNFAPATIYLGDSGSLFLGFFLATLAIHSSQKSSTLLALVVPFVAFGLPLMDTTLAVVRRFLSRRPLFTADQDHLHHRLLRQRLSPRVAVLLLYALAALFSLGSLLIVHSTGSLIALVAILAGASGWFLTSRIQYEELSELNVYVARAVHSQRHVLANQILIRKASRQLEAAAKLEESWRVLVSTLEALDFDEVSSDLPKWPNGRAPSLPGWSRPGEDRSEDCWHVSIPLHAGERVVGELQLYRELAKGRLLFQFSSLLDTLIPPLENQLQRCYEAQEKALAGELGVLRTPTVPPAILANDRKA